MNDFKNNNKNLGSQRADHAVTISENAERSGQQRFECDILIRAICHDVFPETTKRLGSGDKYRNMVSVFSPAATIRAKKALYGKLINNEFDLFNWLQSMKVDVGLKIEFLQIVARALGDDWSNDSRSFIDITIAMSRLQLLLRKLCQSELAASDQAQLGSAIIVVPPGESHQFGQCIVEELFSTRGWKTQLLVPETVDELIEHIIDSNHDIVCISWSSTALSGIVKQTISAIEQIEIGKRPAIIAGGGAALEGGKWMVNLGVDCICDSAFSAMNIAENMIAKTRLELIEQTPSAKF